MTAAQQFKNFQQAHADIKLCKAATAATDYYSGL